MVELVQVEPQNYAPRQAVVDCSAHRYVTFHIKISPLHFLPRCHLAESFCGSFLMVGCHCGQAFILSASLRNDVQYACRAWRYLF